MAPRGKIGSLYTQPSAAPVITVVVIFTKHLDLGCYLASLDQDTSALRNVAHDVISRYPPRQAQPQPAGSTRLPGKYPGTTILDIQHNYGASIPRFSREIESLPLPAGTGTYLVPDAPAGLLPRWFPNTDVTLSFQLLSRDFSPMFDRS